MESLTVCLNSNCNAKLSIINTKIEYIRRGIQNNLLTASTDRAFFNGVDGMSIEELKDLKETIKLLEL